MTEVPVHTPDRRSQEPRSRALEPRAARRRRVLEFVTRPERDWPATIRMALVRGTFFAFVALAMLGIVSEMVEPLRASSATLWAVPIGVLLTTVVVSLRRRARQRAELYQRYLAAEDSAMTRRASSPPDSSRSEMSRPPLRRELRALLRRPRDRVQTLAAVILAGALLVPLMIVLLGTIAGASIGGWAGRLQGGDWSRLWIALGATVVLLGGYFAIRRIRSRVRATTVATADPASPAESPEE